MNSSKTITRLDHHPSFSSILPSFLPFHPLFLPTSSSYPLSFFPPLYFPTFLFFSTSSHPLSNLLHPPLLPLSIPTSFPSFPKSHCHSLLLTFCYSPPTYLFLSFYLSFLISFYLISHFHPISPFLLYLTPFFLTFPLFLSFPISAILPQSSLHPLYFLPYLISCSLTSSPFLLPSTPYYTYLILPSLLLLYTLSIVVLVFCKIVRFPVRIMENCVGEIIQLTSQ